MRGFSSSSSGSRVAAGCGVSVVLFTDGLGGEFGWEAGDVEVGEVAAGGEFEGGSEVGGEGGEIGGGSELEGESEGGEGRELGEWR